MFLQDLAVVMIVAGLVTILCHRFKQPVVLGYILAGVIIGPHTPPFPLVHEQETIRTLAELGALKGEDGALRQGGAIDSPQFPAPGDDQSGAIGVQGRGVRMDGDAARKLAGFGGVQGNLKQLCVAGAVAGEKHLPVAGEKRALQKVRRVIDVRAVGNLADHALLR